MGRPQLGDGFHLANRIGRADNVVEAERRLGIDHLGRIQMGFGLLRQGNNIFLLFFADIDAADIAVQQVVPFVDKIGATRADQLVAVRFAVLRIGGDFIHRQLRVKIRADVRPRHILQVLLNSQQFHSAFIDDFDGSLFITVNDARLNAVQRRI